MKQTAVEWLVSKFRPINWSDEMFLEHYSDIIEQAKQMEKEQIVDAFDYGQFDLGMEADEYYNETFKSE